MNSKSIYRPFNLFSIVLFGLLFFYLLGRVILVEPIHDELATLFFYIDYGTIWNGPLDANNHLLNSYLSKVAYSIFGDHIWAIRLPNLLSFIIYFFAAFKIAQFFKREMFKYVFLISLTCIPFVLDYFAYSRGYGLSMALLLAAVYQFIRINQDYKTKHLILLAFFIVLSIYANLNIILSGVLIFGYIAVKLFIQAKNTKKYRLFISFSLVSLVVIAALIPAVIFALKLKDSGALYYGSKDGLWLTTGVSLSKLILNSSVIIIKYILLSAILFLVFHLITQWKSKGSTQVFNQTSTLFIGLFLGNIIAIESMRWIMGVNYPEDRVGMHLIPYFIGAILFSLQYYTKPFQWLAFVFLLLPALGWKHFNFITSVFSPDDRMEIQDFDFYSRLINSDKSSSLYNTQQLTYAYHVRKENPTNFVVPSRFILETKYNEEIVSSKIDGYNDAKAKGYESLRYNPNTWQNIVEQIVPYNWEKVSFKQKKETPVSSMYYNLLDTLGSDIKENHIKFEFTCKVNTPKLRQETLVLVVTKETPLDSIATYDSFTLNWAAGKNREYTFKRIVEINTTEMEEVKVYLYNPNELDYTILEESATIWTAP